MIYVDDFQRILEMAEQENERMIWLLVNVLNVPVIITTPDGGLLDANI